VKKVQIETDLEKLNLKGKVKSIEMKSYKTLERYGEIIPDTNNLEYTQIYIFNKSGFITDDEYINNTNDSEWRYSTKTYKSFEYNSDNLLVKTKASVNDYENKSFDYVESYSEESFYDEFGKKDSMITIKRDKPKSEKIISTFKYDEEDRILEKRDFKTNERFGEITLGEINQLQKFTYTIDNETNLKKTIEEVYDDKGDFFFAYITYYDEDLNKKEKHMYLFRDDELANITYYNKDGDRIKYTAYREGEVIYELSYNTSEFDSFGNFTKEIVTNQEGEVDVINIFKIEYY
jgi:hypothetical protein